jgi:hypothetical protein
MSEPSVSVAQPRFKPHWYAILAAVFALTLAIRLYGVFQFGFGYDEPNDFMVINFDEAGGCRALLGGTHYNKFVGYQILGIQKLMGEGPGPENFGNDNWRKFCHSRSSLIVHRVYAAVVGAGSVVLLGVLALFMWPERSQIAWTACALLGLSNLHVAHSHFGTVDTAQLFFLGLLTVALGYAMVSNRRWTLWISPLLLIAAIWTKSNIFAVFAFMPLLPDLKLGKYWKEYAIALLVILFLWASFVGKDAIEMSLRRYQQLLWGPESSRFGTAYGHIGSWRRWIRNGINLPVVHIVGISLPAFIAAVYGLKRALKTRREKSVEWRFWLLQTPAACYFSYMFLLAPSTYYRYYLPLFPTVALLAAYGFWESRWATKKWAVVLFVLYPALLTLDSEYNYSHDPRRELAGWLDETPMGRDSGLLKTYYVVGPKGLEAPLFSPDLYRTYGARYLKGRQYLVLNESWYDTAFSSELNGPFGWNPEWAIKTTPLHARIYRRILAGKDPALELERAITLKHFTPEMLVHRWCYGSFPLFVSDVMIYRVK